jgi:hypothetical protein
MQHQRSKGGEMSEKSKRREHIVKKQIKRYEDAKKLDPEAVKAFEAKAEESRKQQTTE